MASYTETRIFEGLASLLSTLVFSPALPIAWPGLDHVPAEAGYIEVGHFPNVPEQITLGDSGYNRHTGIFQVSVMWPQGDGLTVPMEKASQIAAHFKRGTVITRETQIIRVDRLPAIARQQEEPPFVRIPVSVSYMADAANPA